MYVQLKVFVTYLSILFQICSCHFINGFLRNICTVFSTLCHNTFICSDALPDTSYILADITLLYLPFYVKISEDSNKKWVDRLHRLPMKKLSINFLFYFHSLFKRPRAFKARPLLSLTFHLHLHHLHHFNDFSKWLNSLPKGPQKSPKAPPRQLRA